MVLFIGGEGGRQRGICCQVYFNSLKDLSMVVEISKHLIKWGVGHYTLPFVNYIPHYLRSTSCTPLVG